jgi:DNA-binding transcriptional LysR family regulator
MNKQSWDGIKFVLAVAQEGSLNAAAKKLGVTHATVMRRVASFEAKIGCAVFLKTASGYSVLPEADAILLAARNVEDAVLSVDRAVLNNDQALSGVVRIASTDSLCQILLPGISKSISSKYPDLSLALLSANTYHDLSRLSADIAVRPMQEPTEGLVGTIAGQLYFHPYGTDNGDAHWIGLKGALKRSKAAQWMDENIPADQIVHEADSFLVSRELSASGLGKTVLPCFVGDQDPRLKRVCKPFPTISVPVWVAAQEEVSRNVRFCAVQEILVGQLSVALSQYRTDER